MIDIKIKSRINNNFYCKCFFHNNSDFSLRIIEDKKIYCCYGCLEGGSIVSLVSNLYGISMDESIELLYRYISNELDLLNKNQLDILKELFKYYDFFFTEQILEDSQKRTEKLDERIIRYINNKKCQQNSEVRLLIG